jgi:MSHA biogenesis protein MshK
MADRMSLKKAIQHALAFFIAFSSAAALAWQPDPTQPPAVFTQEDGVVEAARVSELESVLLPKKGRPLAVIGGQQVRLGDYLGDRRLIRVTEREAVLEGPTGVERLFLTPGIAKTASTTKNEEKASQGTIRRRKP